MQLTLVLVVLAGTVKLKALMAVTQLLLEHLLGTVL
jgi:hypothetical protein